MRNYKSIIWLGVLILILSQSVPAQAANSSWQYFSGNRIELTYAVQPGDTLSGIAQHFGIDLDTLVSANRLDSYTIYPNDLLLIPGHYEPAPSFLEQGDVDQSDLLLLARVINAEARGEPFSGQVAVGAVVINRLTSPAFPKTIRGIIMQHYGSSYQFQSVADGAIDLTPDASAVRAAISALNGRDPSNGALFFYNPAETDNSWIRNLPVITRIGNQVFATEEAACQPFIPEGLAADLPLYWYLSAHSSTVKTSA